MDFVYAPEGAKERRWRWAPRKMKLAETELVEELTGDLFWEWVNNVVAGSMRAAHVLIYLRLRDEIPDLDYDTIDFNAGEIGWDLDDEEILAALHRLEEQAEDGPLSEEDEARLASFRDRLGVKAPAPKAPEVDKAEERDNQHYLGNGVLVSPAGTPDAQPSLLPSASSTGDAEPSGTLLTS